MMLRLALLVSACWIWVAWIGSVPARASNTIHCVQTSDHPVGGPCLFADTFDVTWGPVSSHWTVSLNFGLAWSHAGQDNSAGIELICEEAYGRATPEDVLVDEAGWIYTPGFYGLVRSRGDDGCTWTQVAGFPPEIFVRQVTHHPARPQRYLALTVEGLARVIYTSQDGGNSFTSGFRFPDNAFYWRIDIAPSNPDVIWANGRGLHGAFALGRSNDGSNSFTLIDPVPALADTHITTTLWAIAPDDPDVLFFARTTPEAGEEIWKSVDGGQTAARILALPDSHILTGLTFGDDPQTLYAAGRELLRQEDRPPAHLYISRDGGDTWLEPIPSSPTGPRYRCLHWRDGKLWACGPGPAAGDNFLLGTSEDEGRSWQPVLTMTNLPPPKACVAHLCQETGAWLCDAYQICGPDAGIPLTDAGPDGAVKDGSANDAASVENGGGCGCRVGQTTVRARPVPGWTVLLAGLMAVRIVRRRRPTGR